MEKVEQLHYTTEWYDNLVSDIKAMIEKAKVETGIRLIRLKWEVGNRIVESNDYLKFGRREHGNKTQADLARDLGLAHRQRISEIVNFRMKAGPDFNAWLAKSADSVGTLSWRKIVREWLHKRRRKPVDPTPLPGVGEFELICGDFREMSNKIESGSVDIIITDPPYGKKYIPLYEDLAEMSARVLKDNGSMVVMVGQSYLFEILQNLSKYLTYNWVVAYLTPGGQSAQLWDRRVNTFWKPVLWFVKGKYEGNWIGDVAKSKANEPDKRYSEYGQSESGVLDIVKRFVKPTQIVLDPFMGAGTTGVMALKLGCHFIGIDNDPKMVEIAEKRLKGLV